MRSLSAFKDRMLNCTYVRDQQQADQLTASILQWGPDRVAVDFETTRDRIRLMQFGFQARGPQGLRGRQLVFDCDHVDPGRLRGLLTAPGTMRLIHHSQFEQGWTAKQLGFVISDVWDSCLAWKAIQAQLAVLDAGQVQRLVPGWASHPNRLDVLCQRVLGFALPKDEQTSDWGARTLSDRQIQYAALDVAVLAPLQDRTVKLLDVLGLTDAVAEQARLVGQRAGVRNGL